MAASGRKLKVYRSTDSGTTWNILTCVQSKSVNKTIDYADITNDDADGHRKLLQEPGNRSTDINVSGVTDDDVLMTAISQGTSSIAFEYLKVEYPSGATDIGSFAFSNLNQTGETQGAVNYEATFLSTGELAFTAAP